MSETPAQPENAQPTAEPPEFQHEPPFSAEDKTLDRLLAEAQERINEQREAWLRALADAENARKRAQADIAAAHKFGIERLVESLLPVCDSLEAALAVENARPDALTSGVELTLRQLRGAFEKANLAEIIPTPGERFDPNRHQAMTAVESEAEPNTVLSILRKGYSLHERVIRPALVTVAKAKSVESGAANPISGTGIDSN